MIPNKAIIFLFQQDEQWVDFEDEKDYSGLRIQNLQIG